MHGLGTSNRRGEDLTILRVISGVGGEATGDRAEGFEGGVEGCSIAVFCVVYVKSRRW